MIVELVKNKQWKHKYTNKSALTHTNTQIYICVHIFIYAHTHTQVDTNMSHSSFTNLTLVCAT